MKLTTLESLERSLETMTHRIVVPEAIAARARLAIERMVSIGGRAVVDAPVPVPASR